VPINTLKKRKGGNTRIVGEGRMRLQGMGGCYLSQQKYGYYIQETPKGGGKDLTLGWLCKNYGVFRGGGTS